MPTPYDLLSAEMDDEEDPEDQLRNALGLQQGKNLVGGPLPPGAPPPDPTPGIGPPPGNMASPQPMAPSPNVPGPLAALVPKPKIKLKLAPPKIKPHIKLKSKKNKPHIKLKAASYA
jgi:hypothetical protein